MNESHTVLPPKWMRKAMLERHGVTVAELATQAQCSEQAVRRCLRGPNRADTRKVKQIKALVARRVGMAIAELWPEDEPDASHNGADPIHSENETRRGDEPL